MKIASATMELSASHMKLQQHELYESFRMRSGDRRPDFGDSKPMPVIAVQPRPQIQLSDAGRTAQSSEASGIQSSLEAAERDPNLRMIRAMVAMMTGHEVDIFDAADLASAAPPVDVQAPPPPANTTSTAQRAGFSAEYERYESYTEIEQTNFEASGVIKTEDGMEIAFSLSLSMTYIHHEESSTTIQFGDARKKQDPLVINFNGPAAQLSSQRFKFDLNSDGQNEDINFAAGGSGFLALDRNGDGRINNGSELFGANSGNGFAELAAFDDDQNGWIDENDRAYAQLRVWTRDAAGNDTLATLRQANVGAISLGRAETPFDLKDSANALQGQIRSSGIFLQEDGRAGTIQQVDLTV